MIADFNAIDRHKMYDFKWNNLLNVLDVHWQRRNSGEIVCINMKRVCGFAVSH